MINLFESLGFLIQQEKCVTDPAQSLEYIGLVIDKITMSFSLPEKKREKLLGQCSKAYTSKTVLLKELASLLGILNWASQSVEYAPAHFRNLQATYTRQSKAAFYQLSLLYPPRPKKTCSGGSNGQSLQRVEISQLAAQPSLFTPTPLYPAGEQ